MTEIALKKGEEGDLGEIGLAEVGDSKCGLGDVKEGENNEAGENREEAND